MEYGHDAARGALQHYLTNYASRSVFIESVRNYSLHIYGSILRKSRKKYFLDKTPAYTRITKELHEIFPAAKFIVLKRNPLAILNSIISTWVGANFDKLYEYEYVLTKGFDDILDTIKALRDKAYVLKYEDLIKANHHELYRLCHFLEITLVDEFRYAPQVQTGDSPTHFFHGDLIKINRHDGFVDDYENSWLSLADNRQKYELAKAFMQGIGSDKFAELGYDYENLAEILERSFVKKNSPHKYFIPWNIAIKDPRKRTVHDRLAIRRIRYLNRHGSVLGYLRYIANCHRDIIKAVKSRSI
jgi:hypothetical protein